MTENGRKGKTAVVFVHGQGEHVPLGSAPELARTTWATDPKVGTDNGGKGDEPGAARLKLTPDASIGDEETPRATVPAKSGVEFFEFYWSDLMTGNQFAHVWRWFRNLIRKPAEETPRRILPVRQLFIRVAEVGGVFIAAYALFTVSVALLLNEGEGGESPREFFAGQCWTTGGPAPIGWPGGLERALAGSGTYGFLDENSEALRSPVLHRTLGINVDSMVEATAYESMCRDAGYGFPIGDSTRDNSEYRQELSYLPVRQRTARIGCQALDSVAMEHARTAAACATWRAGIMDGSALPESEGHNDGVLWSEFDPKGQRVVTASYDGTARIWNASPDQGFLGEEIRSLDHNGSGVLIATFSSDGALVATVAYDGQARVWDSNTGVLVATFTQDGVITDVAFSPDGRRLAIGDSLGNAAIWDIATATRLFPLMGHMGSIASIVYSHDGTRVLTASNDNTARLWNAETGEAYPQVLRHEDWVTDAVFSPQDDRVATASWDYTVRIWNTANGSAALPPLPHNGVVNMIAFSPDGRRLAAAVSDFNVQIWDTARGTPVTTLSGHNDIVSGVAYSPVEGGSQLLSWSADGSTRIWDLAGKAPTSQTIYHAQSVSRASFSSDGQRVLTSSWDTSAQISDLNGALLASLGMSRTNTPYDEANSLANDALADLRNELVRNQGVRNEQNAGTAAEPDSPFDYLTTWLNARRTTGVEYTAMVAAPIVVGGVILFVVFADWSGLARRSAAEAPRRIQRRFERSPAWLYLIVLLVAPFALTVAYSAIWSATSDPSAFDAVRAEQPVWPVWLFIGASTTVAALGGLALLLLGRRLVDANALRSIGALPERKRNWRTKPRSWSVLLWIPLYASIGLITMVATGLRTPGMLVAVAVPIVIDVIVFTFRRRLLSRNPDLSRWPFAWNLVNVFAFAVFAAVGLMVVEFNSYVTFDYTPFTLVLAWAGGIAGVAGVIALLVFLTDPAGGAIRHLLFAVVAGLIGMLLVVFGFATAERLPTFRTFLEDNSMLIGVALCGVVVAALALHLIRAIVVKAQRSRIVRVFLTPSLVAALFVIAVAGTVDFLGRQIDQQQAIVEANREITTALSLQDSADSAPDAWTRLLRDNIFRNDELSHLASWTYYDIRRQRLLAEEGDTPPLPAGGSEFRPPISATVHGGGILGDVAFTPDGRRLVTVAGDGSVELWDAATGKLLTLVDGPPQLTQEQIDAGETGDYLGVVGVAVSARGDTIAGVTSDGTVKVWYVNESPTLSVVLSATIPVDPLAATSMAFSPTQDLLATVNPSGAVELWDTRFFFGPAQPEPLRTLNIGDAAIANVMDYSADGLRLTAGYLAGDVAVWDVDLTSDSFGEPRNTFVAHSGMVRDVALSPDGTRLATVGWDGAAYLWDSSGDSPAPPQISQLVTPQGVIELLAFSPDGSWLASSNFGYSVSLWDPNFGWESKVLYGHEREIIDIVWSPDGSALATASADTTVRIWRTSLEAKDFGLEIDRLRGHDSGLSTVAFSPSLERRRFATGGWEGAARIWNVGCATLTGDISYGQFAECFQDTLFSIPAAPRDEEPAPASDPAFDSYAQVYDSPVYYAEPVAEAAVDPYASVDPFADPFAASPVEQTEQTDVAQADAGADIYALDTASPDQTDPLFEDAYQDPYYYDTYAEAQRTLQEAQAAARNEAQARRDFFAVFLLELRNELADVSRIGAVQIGLLFVAFAVLTLIWARMLLASLTVAMFAAPFAIAVALSNQVGLVQYGLGESAMAASGVAPLADSPLRLLNAIYAFFLAFCAAWFVTQLMRELLNIRTIRGLSFLALALAASVGLLAYLNLTPDSATPWWSIGDVQLAWTAAVIIVVMVVLGGLFAAAHYFLVPIMADSARYLSPKPQNIARRREIVDRGVRLLRALSRSGRYDRIVVVAHSLGTLVAFDAVSRFWTNFEDTAARPDLRQNRTALLSASTVLAEGVHEALNGAAEDITLARQPQRVSKKAAAAPAKPIVLRTDEARVDRICELLSELALNYGKAGKPRPPKRKADPEAAARKVKGAAARAAAAEALWAAIRAIRVGPASFGEAAAKLREAAGLVRSAYGIDPEAPSRFSLSSKRTLGEAEAIAGALESSADRLSSVAPLLERYLGCQQRLASALMSGPAEERWLVTDLITMGSPLTHGEYLLGADHRVRTYQEGSDAAVAKAVDALKGRLVVEQQAVAPVADGAHADALDELEAAFPASRWTNLYFRGEGVLGGDIVGGPVWTVFGPGVIDMALDGKPNGSSFAHNEYWKSSMADDAMCGGDAPAHIRALRQALRLI
jgi:WD40 repeat protein